MVHGSEGGHGRPLIDTGQGGAELLTAPPLSPIDSRIEMRPRAVYSQSPQERSGRVSPILKLFSSSQPALSSGLGCLHVLDHRHPLLPLLLLSFCGSRIDITDVRRCLASCRKCIRAVNHGSLCTLHFTQFQSERRHVSKEKAIIIRL